MKNNSVVEIHVKSDHQELLAKIARFVIETSPEEIPLEAFREKLNVAIDHTFRDYNFPLTSNA